jgi:hypothetical protein
MTIPKTIIKELIKASRTVTRFSDGTLSDLRRSSNFPTTNQRIATPKKKDNFSGP